MHVEWTFVNIFLPALLPVIVLTVLSIFDLGRAANSNAHPFVAVKDGQLAWAGLGMCLNALYELRHPNEKSIAAQFPPDTLFLQLISATLILTLIAALGPVFTTPMTLPAGAACSGPKYRRYVARCYGLITHFKIFFITVTLTLFAGFLYWKTHLLTQTSTSI